MIRQTLVVSLSAATLIMADAAPAEACSCTPSATTAITARRTVQGCKIRGVWVTVWVTVRPPHPDSEMVLIIALRCWHKLDVRLAEHERGCAVGRDRIGMWTPDGTSDFNTSICVG